MNIKDLKAGSYTVSNPAETSAATPAQGGVGSKIADAFSKHTNAAADVQLSNQSPISKAVQTVGQGAGFVGDTAYEGAKAITPQPVKDVAKEVLNTVGESGPVQEGLQAYNSWKTAHPEAAGNLEATFNIASLLPAFKAGGKAAETVADTVGGSVNNTGKALKAAGEGVYGVTVNPQESTSRAMLAYDSKQPTLGQRIAGMKSVGTKPITEANTAARKGLVGTEYGIGVSAKRVADDLWSKEIAPALSKSGLKVNMGEFFNNIEKEIKNSTSDLSRRNALQEALGSMREDYKNVRSVSVKKLQDYKSEWAKFLPDKVYNGKPIGGAFKEIQNMAAGRARSILHEAVGPEGKQAYIDYGNLQSIIEAGVKSTTGDVAKKSLGRNVWQVVMDKAVTPIATTAGQVLYKTGEGLEFLGKPGAVKVKDIIQ